MKWTDLGRGNAKRFPLRVDFRFPDNHRGWPGEWVLRSKADGEKDGIFPSGQGGVSDGVIPVP